MFSFIVNQLTLSKESKNPNERKRGDRERKRMTLLVNDDFHIIVSMLRNESRDNDNGMEGY